MPALAKVPAEQFGRYLSYGEMGLGAALLTPTVPGWAAGLALGAFSGGLTQTGAGVAAAIVLGYLAAIVFQPKMKA